MAQRIGDSNLAFGCTDETWGYITDLVHNQAPKFSEGLNGQGELVAGEFHDLRQTVSFTYVHRAVTGQPEDLVGTSTTITMTDVGSGSTTLYILSASATRTVGDWRKVACEAAYFPSLGS